MQRHNVDDGELVLMSILAILTGSGDRRAIDCYTHFDSMLLKYAKSRLSRQPFLRNIYREADSECTSLREAVLARCNALKNIVHCSLAVASCWMEAGLDK